jgi:hypothetical protein
MVTVIMRGLISVPVLVWMQVWMVVVRCFCGGVRVMLMSMLMLMGVPVAVLMGVI